MCSALNNVSIIYNQNLIGVLNRCKTMCYNDNCFTYG